MAAPHVTGIVALLYQVDPMLEPAEVEWVLEETAHKFTSGAGYQEDPLHPGATSSYDKGHGLVDARDAVEAVLHPLVVSSPAEGAAVDGSVQVEGRIWYGDSVDIALDGDPVVTLENVNRFWAHTLPGLAPGQHTITVTMSSGDRVVHSIERTVHVS
jgi:subtilisin family serine protease